MKLHQKSSNNRSMLNLNISLIEETSPTFKNFTPKDGGRENDPEKTLKTAYSQLDLLKTYSPKDKLHTQFTKYESSLGFNKTLSGIKSTTNL